MALTPAPMGDGFEATVRFEAASPGWHHVTVRVTDNSGKRAYATRTVRVT